VIADIDEPDGDHLSRMFELSSQGAEKSQKLVNLQRENMQRADAVYERLVRADTLSDEDKRTLAVYAEQIGPGAVQRELERLVERCELDAIQVRALDPSRPEHAGLLFAQAEQFCASESTARTMASFIRTYHEIMRRVPSDREGGK
jgi:hypothetical protein